MTDKVSSYRRGYPNEGDLTRDEFGVERGRSDGLKQPL